MFPGCTCVEQEALEQEGCSILLESTAFGQEQKLGSIHRPSDLKLLLPLEALGGF